MNVFTKLSFSLKPRRHLLGGILVAAALVPLGAANGMAQSKEYISVASQVPDSSVSEASEKTNERLKFWGLTARDLQVTNGIDMLTRALKDHTMEQLSAAGGEGDVVAQYLVGVAYINGKGVTADPVKATEWIAKAAKQGLARAAGVYGQRMIAGTGTEEDILDGWSLLVEAEKVNLFSRLLACQVILIGVETPDGRRKTVLFRRPEDAREDLLQLAKDGFASAQYLLGWSYVEGDSRVNGARLRAKNKKEAIKWLTLAAAGGDSSATKLLKTVQP